MPANRSSRKGCTVAKNHGYTYISSLLLERCSLNPISPQEPSSWLKRTFQDENVNIRRNKSWLGGRFHDQRGTTAKKPVRSKSREIFVMAATFATLADGISVSRPAGSRNDARSVEPGKLLCRYTRPKGECTAKCCLCTCISNLYVLYV